jgi:excisionase family DNA binding protein
MLADEPESLGRFLTAGDVARILNVELGDVAELVRTGQLPAIRIGRPGRLRVERDVLESYIQAMYEESRRTSLWEQSQFANLPELAGGRVVRR